MDDTSSYCNSCGARIDNKSNVIVSEDSSSFGFAILGFFIPIVGLILFLIYNGYFSETSLDITVKNKAENNALIT